MRLQEGDNCSHYLLLLLKILAVSLPLQLPESFVEHLHCLLANQTLLNNRLAQVCSTISVCLEDG
jgi:hypothetical protein